jgi:hypothetical protein
VLEIEKRAIKRVRLCPLPRREDEDEVPQEQPDPD